MNRIQKTLVSGAMALGILAGGTVAAPLVTADRASAYTTSQCSSYYQYGWNYVEVCYYDYSWWEEVWGYRDGWYKTNRSNA